MASITPTSTNLPSLLDGKEDFEALLEHLSKRGSKPYSVEDEKIFEACTKATEWARFCVSWKGYTIALLLPSVLAVISLNVGDFLDEKSSKNGMIAAAVLTVVISNFWSMYATGDVTAKASEWQNKDQNAIEELGKRFTKLGKYMIYNSVDFCKKTKMTILARKINVLKIAGDLKKVSTQELKVDQALDYFGKTIDYFRSSTTTDPELLLDIAAAEAAALKTAFP